MLSTFTTQSPFALQRKTAPEQSKKIRLLLVDCHPILRESFAWFIGRETDLEVCAQAGDAASAFEQLRALAPQLVLIEISMDGDNGIHFIKQVHGHFPQANILVFSHQDEALYAERALRAGAKGYIMKQAPIEEVMSAIRKVGQGGRYLSRPMQERMLEAFANGSRTGSIGIGDLSDRELEVFKKIGAGFSTREIAHELHLSIKTVETYRSHIKRKLGLRNGTQLMQRALQSFNAELSVARDGRE